MSPGGYWVVVVKLLALVFVSIDEPSVFSKGIIGVANLGFGVPGLGGLAGVSGK